MTTRTLRTVEEYREMLAILVNS